MRVEIQKVVVGMSKNSPSPFKWHIPKDKKDRFRRSEFTMQGGGHNHNVVRGPNSMVGENSRNSQCVTGSEFSKMIHNMSQWEWGRGSKTF